MESDHGETEGGPAESTQANRQTVVWGAGAMFGMFLWLTLVWVVYAALPRFQKIFDDFGRNTGGLARFCFHYAGLVIPLIGITAASVWGMNRSRGVQALALYYLPMLLIALLVIVVGSEFLQLMNDLS